MTTIIAFPTLLETFFTDRLVRQKRATPTRSPATVTPSVCCYALPSNTLAKRRRC